MKNKKVLIILGILLLCIVVAYNLYVCISKKNILKYTKNSIEELGYSVNDIEKIEVQHFFINKILGYNEWKIPVVFKKKNNITFWYSYRDNQIIFEGVSSEPMLDKDDVIKYSEEYKKGIFLDIDNEKYAFKAMLPVSLEIKKETLTSNGLTLIIKNDSEYDYTYGPDYYLEKLENGNWVEPQTLTGDPLTWNSIAYTLKAGETKEEVIDFKYSYGELPSGNYRIIKRVFRDEDIPITEDEIERIMVEFKI